MATPKDTETFTFTFLYFGSKFLHLKTKKVPPSLEDVYLDSSYGMRFHSSSHSDREFLCEYKPSKHYSRYSNTNVYCCTYVHKINFYSAPIEYFEKYADKLQMIMSDVVRTVYTMHYTLLPLDQTNKFFNMILKVYHKKKKLY